MSTDESLFKTIDASCNCLEETAASMGVTLKKSTDSIRDLEDIILALLDIKVDSGTLNGATFMVGTYLGEILRMKLGGQWHNSSDNELLLTVGDNVYAPVTKVRRFAANPKGGDGLVFFADTTLALENRV